MLLSNGPSIQHADIYHRCKLPSPNDINIASSGTPNPADSLPTFNLKKLETPEQDYSKIKEHYASFTILNARIARNFFVVFLAHFMITILSD